MCSVLRIHVDKFEKKMQQRLQDKYFLSKDIYAMRNLPLVTMALRKSTESFLLDKA